MMTVPSPDNTCYIVSSKIYIAASSLVQRLQSILITSNFLRFEVRGRVVCSRFADVCIQRSASPAFLRTYYKLQHSRIACRFLHLKEITFLNPFIYDSIPTYLPIEPPHQKHNGLPNLQSPPPAIPPPLLPQRNIRLAALPQH
jgi:hypothetical protein